VLLTSTILNFIKGNIVMLMHRTFVSGCCGSFPALNVYFDPFFRKVHKFNLNKGTHPVLPAKIHKK
jgi:hypothetical protein